MVTQEEFTQAILKKLSDLSVEVKSQWANPVGTMTRHFVIDDLLPAGICMEIHDAFPKDGQGFFSRESFREKKKTSATLGDYSKILSDVTYAFQDPRVVELVSQLVGFDRIEPDPQLYAGGLSMMFRGDFLNPHIDNSHDGARQRYRRLNLLYYVSPEWSEDNGGNFELWDEQRLNPVVITSRFNRLVVMETNKTSWHSVSQVKVDRPRCCVSNYYFSKISPDGESYFHVTSFTGRPGDGFRRFVGVVDNSLRNIISRALKTGRGRHLVNRDKR